MRVVCHTFDDLLTNLRGEASSVYRRTVYVSVTRRPLDTSNRFTACKFDVTIHVSAVVSLEDGQYLLDYGESCGADYQDASQDLAGTKQANEYKERIKKLCDEAGLRVLPGVVDAS